MDFLRRQRLEPQIVLPRLGQKQIDQASVAVHHKGQLVRLGIAQADGQAGLGVSVHQQDLLPGLGQPYPQVGAGGRLADAAFLVGDGDDLRVHSVSPHFC